MGPLYPYFLSLVYSTVGHDLLVVRLLQALGGAVTVVMTFHLGRMVFRPAVGLLAALMLCFYGAITFYEGQMLMTWLGTMLNISALAVLMSAGRHRGLLRLCDRRRPHRCLGAGACQRARARSHRGSLARVGCPGRPALGQSARVHGRGVPLCAAGDDSQLRRQP